MSRFETMMTKETDKTQVTTHHAPCQTENGGINTREGVRRGVETRVRMKRGSGMKGLVDKSRGIVSLITVVFANINPIDIVYQDSIKRELNKRLMFDSRCDTRLKPKAEGCTHLVNTM